jgi:hypothetical protein
MLLTPRSSRPRGAGRRHGPGVSIPSPAARTLTDYATGYEVPGVTFNGSRSTNYLLTRTQFATYDGANARWIPFGSAPYACA